MTNKFASLEFPVDEPGRMVIMHPGSNQPFRDAEGKEAYIDLLSGDSQKAQAFDRRVLAQRIARRNPTTNLAVEEIEASQIDRMAHLTTGWSLVGRDGTKLDVECNEANARELYSAPIMFWLREQVAFYQSNRANFFGASSTT